MEDAKVAIRLKGFIDAEGLTHSQFADRCGIPRPSLSQILSGRNKKISDVIVGQIHAAFPELSVLWLLFGEGSMMVTSPSDTKYGEDEPNLFSNTNEFVGDKSESQKYENLNGLNMTQKGGQLSDLYSLDTELKITELQKQIDKLMRNPRKVSQITVYYDDSTFETFYPKR
ncbi:MAG: hypothetical protein NC204_04420 [Candidatus Amulumruptor caecigallinarius]|nr:hypothetical protein [Candidatus Amulumruptor caecigallinarius]